MTEVPRKPLSTRLPSSIPSINVAQPATLGSKLLQPSKLAPPLVTNVAATNTIATTTTTTSLPKLAPLKPIAAVTATSSIAPPAISTSTTSKLLTRSAIPSALPSFKPNSIASSIPAQAPVASAIPSFIARADSIPVSASESTPAVSPAPSPIVAALPAPTTAAVILPSLAEVEEKREAASTPESIIPLPSELIESKVEECEKKESLEEESVEDEFDEDEEAARREEEDGFGKFTIPEHDPSDFDSATSMRSNNHTTAASSSSSSTSTATLSFPTDVKPVFKMEVEEDESTIARREQAIESASIHQQKLQEEICLYSTKLAAIMTRCEESNLYSSSEFVRNLLHQIRTSEGVKFDLSEVE